MTKAAYVWHQLLKILPDAYATVPQAVLNTCDNWVEKFLVSNLATVRHGTVEWLHDYVFVGKPLSDSTDLDAERARQARKLVAICTAQVRDGFERGRLRSRFEGLVGLLRRIGVLLRTLQTQVSEMVESGGRDVSIKLRTQVDEIPPTLKILKDLDTEILSNWQLDAGAQGALQDVRTSVEASEEFVSSDEYDDDDDESLSLD